MTKTVVVPGHLEVKDLSEGEAAPFDGMLIPPSVMAEMGDCLGQVLRKGDQQRD